MLDKTSKAFSMIELLLTLVILSCVLAAFAPIFTKSIITRMKGTESVTNIKDIFLDLNSVNTNGDFYKCDENITTTADTKTLKCTLKNIDSSTINVIMAGAGGGGAGGAFGDVDNIKKEFFPTGNSKEQNSVDVVKNMKNVRVSLFASGGSGGGAVEVKNTKYITYSALSEPNSFSHPDISNFGVSIASAPGGGGGAAFQVVEPIPPDTETQVTSYCGGSGANGNSLKDMKIPDKYIPSEAVVEIKGGVEGKGGEAGSNGISGIAGGTGEDAYLKIYDKTKSDSNLTFAIIVHGSTGGEGGKIGDTRAETPGGTRGTCERFIAKGYGEGTGTWEKNLNCENLAKDLGGNYSGSDGTGGGKQTIVFVEKPNGKQGCVGGNPVNTYPRGGTGGNVQINHAFDGKIYPQPGNQSGELSNIKTSFNYLAYETYGGGGGSAGSAVLDKQIPDEIIQKCVSENLNCKIIFDVGEQQDTVGTGSVKTNSGGSDASNGYDGKPTSVIVKSYFNSKILWGYKVKGGIKGNGATTSAAGEETTEDMKCAVYSGSNWRAWTNCGDTSDAFKGQLGDIGALNFSGDFSSAAGGNGGKYASEYGQGGRGGSVLIKNAVSPDLNGAAGQPGHASISYKIIKNGAPGGGGGGGAMIRKEKIQITSDKNYEIQIGGAGKGGNIGETGYNGGDTVVKFDTTYIAYGGKAGSIGMMQTDTTPAQAGEAGIGGKASITESGSIGGTRHGENGQGGFIDIDNTGIGGSGGRSGISISTEIIKHAVACGGYYKNKELKCENDNANAFGGVDLEKFFEPVYHIHRNWNYGSYGAGGGGGGWKYDYENEKENVGKGGSGQGGYVYLWWNPE